MIPSQNGFINDCPSFILEVLAVFLKREAISRKIDMVQYRILEITLKCSRAGESEVRQSSLRLLESLILGISVEKAIEVGFYDIAFKILKNVISSNEKSLGVRAASLRFIHLMIPRILKNSTFVIQLQTLLLKEMMSSPGVGHIYGIFLSSLIQNAPTQQISTRVSIEGIPSHLKEVESFYTVLDHIRSMFVKYNRSAHRESIARCSIAFLQNVEIEDIQHNINRLLYHFGEIITNPNLKVNKAVLIPETKSALSMVFRHGVVYKMCSSKKQKLLEKMYSYLESMIDESKNINDARTYENFSLNISFLLGEVYYLMGLLGEAILPIDVDFESLVFSIMSIGSQFLTTFDIFNSTEYATIWNLLGLILSRYSNLNDHYKVNISKFKEFTYEESSKHSNFNPIYSFWPLACALSGKKVPTDAYQSLVLFEELMRKSNKENQDLNPWKASAWMLLYATLNTYNPIPDIHQSFFFQNFSVSNLLTLWSEDTDYKTGSEMASLSCLFSALSLTAFMKRFTTHLNQDIYGLAVEKFRSLIGVITSMDDIKHFNLKNSLMLALLDLYNTINENVDLTKKEIFFPKDLPQIIRSMIANYKFNQGHHILRHYMNHTDCIIDTKPEEFLGVNFSPTKSNLHFQASVSNFFTSLRSLDRYIDNKVNCYYPLHLQCLDRMVYTFSTMFFKMNATDQELQIAYFEEQLRSYEHEEHLNTSVLNYLFTLLVICKRNSMEVQSLSKDLLSIILKSATTYIYSPNSLHRRVAAYIIAYICEADEEIHMVTAKRFLFSLQSITDDCSLMGNIFCFAIMHKIVGGIRTRTYCTETINAQCNILKRAYTLKHHEMCRHSLHSLWISLEESGISFHSFSKNIIGLIHDIYNDNFTYEMRFYSQIGRIVSAIAHLLGPEMMAETSQLESIQSTMTFLDMQGRCDLDYLDYMYNCADSEKYVDRYVIGSFINPLESSFIIREKIMLYTTQPVNFYIKTCQQSIDYLGQYNAFDYEEGALHDISPIASMKLVISSTLKLLFDLHQDSVDVSSMASKLLHQIGQELPLSEVKIALIDLFKLVQGIGLQRDALKWSEICCQNFIQDDQEEELLPTDIAPFTYMHSREAIELATIGIKSTLMNLSTHVIASHLEDYSKVLVHSYLSSCYEVRQACAELLFTILNVLETNAALPKLVHLMGRYAKETFTTKFSESSFQMVSLSFIIYGRLLIWIMKHSKTSQVIVEFLSQYILEIPTIEEPLISFLHKNLIYHGWLISLSYVFQNADNNEIKKHFNQPDLMDFIKRGWTALLNYQDSNLFNIVDMVSVEYDEILYSICNHFPHNDPRFLKLYLGLVIQALSCGRNIKKSLLTLTALLTNITPYALEEALLSHWIILQEIFILFLTLFKKMYKNYENKITLLETVQELIRIIFQGGSNSATYNSMCCNFVIDIVNWESNAIKTHTTDYLSQFTTRVSDIWRTIKSREEFDSKFMLLLFKFPENLYTKSEATEELSSNILVEKEYSILHAIQSIQLEQHDSFLHYQINTLLQMMENASQMVSLWYYKVILTTLLSLKKEIGQIDIHAKILSFGPTHLHTESLDSIIRFLDGSLSSKNSAHVALGQSYISVLSPVITSMLLDRTRPYEADLVIMFIRILSLLQAASKSDIGLKNTITEILSHTLNYDAEESSPEFKVHTFALEQLKQMGQLENDPKHLHSTPTKSKRSLSNY